MSTFFVVFVALFVVAFVLAVICFIIFGRIVWRLVHNHSDPFAPEGVLETILLVWALAIAYNLRAVARLLNRGAAAQSIPMLGSYLAEIQNAEAGDERLQRDFRWFTRVYGGFVLTFGVLFVTALFGPAIAG